MCLKGELASDLAALHQDVHIALSLSLLEAIFGRELRHEIAVAVERGQILLRELATSPGFPRGRSAWSRRWSRVLLQSHWKQHLSRKYLQDIGKMSFE